MRRLKRPLLPAFFIAGLIAAAVVIAQFVGAQQGGGGIAVGGPLLVRNRAALSICVDGAGGARVAGAEADVVRDALEAVLAAASSVPSEYDKRQVVRECPPPLGLTGKVLDFLHRGPVDVGARAISSPDLLSPHRLHIFFVPEQVYAESFGEDAYALTSQEVVCRGDVCIGVTPGLYVRQSVTADILGRALRHALILLPLTPDRAEYAQFCLSGTPEQWCYLQDYCEAVPADPACEDDGIEPTNRPETPLEP
jgi:hypothetical protein